MRLGRSPSILLLGLIFASSALEAVASDGYVTVAQCVEGLPCGRGAWEAIACGFLAWFLLGAINECTPLAFSLVSTEWPVTQQSLLAMVSALAFGNFAAIAVGGYVADTYGRLCVVRPALVLTVAAGLLLQTAGSFAQALFARFVLGLVSGGLLTVIPPLIAELLPSRHRGYYLTVWVCGWPAGGLFALMLGSAVPGLSWHEFYTLVLTPAVFLYVSVRVDMLVESPRFLYMAGQREEGYTVLLDMYEKEELPLPWAQESISVTCAPPRTLMPPTKGSRNKATSYTWVTVWLSLAMFLASAAAQSVTLWMPTMLIAHRADERAGTVSGPLGARAMSNEVVDMSIVNMQNPMAFASGPKALSLLSTVSAPLMLPDPDFTAVRVLAEAYMVEIVGIIMCAYASTWVTRKQMVQWPLFAAAALTGLNLLAAGGRFGALLCGPLVGAQLAAQAVGLSFLQVFASEYFPTSRRAQTVAIAMFAAQLGALTVPVFGGLVVRKASPAAAVAFFSTLYLLAWATSFRLPLSTGPERPLHDVDEEPRTKRSCTDARKRDWSQTAYQSI